MRPSNRNADQLRDVSIETNVSKHAEGSCMIRAGDTHVLCTASVETRIPHWLKGQGRGWVTAEYGMLPRSTGERMDREAARGKQSGRTQEIQRLIGRSLRAVIDLEKIPDMQIKVDCDVIQADGGTRTASITGAYVALKMAVDHLLKIGAITTDPLLEPVAAVSCGLYDGEAVLDLDYAEDSNAQADANYVMTASGGVVEVQATAEDKSFTKEQLDAMFDLARKGIGELVKIQRDALKD